MSILDLKTECHNCKDLKAKLEQEKELHRQTYEEAEIHKAEIGAQLRVAENAIVEIKLHRIAEICEDDPEDTLIELANEALEQIERGE